MQEALRLTFLTFLHIHFFDYLDYSIISNLDPGHKHGWFKLFTGRKLLYENQLILELWDSL